MKRMCIAAFALAAALSALPAYAEEFSEVEYYQKLAAEKLAAPTPTPASAPVYQPVSCFEETPPANAFIAFGQTFNSRNKAASFKMGPDRLRMGKGRANGFGSTLIYNRVMNDWFSFALMYEYGFMQVRGGTAYAPAAAVDAHERTRWHSHVVGVLPEFKLGLLGKLQLSLIQGFDRGSGSETWVAADGTADQRDIDGYGTNVTSLMAWWEKDFELGCGSGWKVSPYAGWRSLYVAVKDQPSRAPGSVQGDTADSNMWVHLVSGGFKLAYQQESLGFNLRAGVSHRTSRDDVPGYGNRAVAPGVVQFSHRANLDKTVGSVGAGVNYAINKRAIVGVGYDGFYGKNTSAHTGTLSFVFPF